MKKFGSSLNASKELLIDQSNLSKYLSGKREPSIEILMRFQSLGLSLDWVTTGRGTMDLPRESNRIVVLMNGKGMTFDEVIDLVRADLDTRPSYVNAQPPTPTEPPEPETDVDADMGYIGGIDGILDYLDKEISAKEKEQEKFERKDGDSVLL